MGMHWVPIIRESPIHGQPALRKYWDHLAPLVGLIYPAQRILASQGLGPLSSASWSNITSSKDSSKARDWFYITQLVSLIHPVQRILAQPGTGAT